MNTTLLPLLDRLGALADETRTRVLMLLADRELTVSELAAALALPQPNVSRHLKTLASEGWLQVRAEGRRRHYALAADLDRSARALWEVVRRDVEERGGFPEDRARLREILLERRRRSEAFFATEAARWDQIREELFGAGAVLAPLLGLLDRGCTVADLGCGTGAFAAAVAPFVHRVVGVDASPEMLEAARLRTQGMAGVAWVGGSLEALPLPDASVDLAVMALVLHYVPDVDAALREAARILVPGGRLVALEFRRHDLGPELTARMGHAWPGFEPDRLARLAADAGLSGAASHALPPTLTAQAPPLVLLTAGRPRTRGAGDGDSFESPSGSARRIPHHREDQS